MALAAVALTHLAWQFDWRGFAGGSSTSGLIFVFVPIYAVAIGLVAALAGAVVAKLVAAA